MTRIALALSMLALTATGLSAETVPQTRIQVVQAGSCASWNATCESRCADAACRKSVCATKMAACQSSGCWTETAANGGARHCGLAKK